MTLTLGQLCGVTPREVKMAKRATGTREWADSTVNCIEGCSHNCWYCYARAMAARFERRRPEHWHYEKVTANGYPMKRFGKRRGRIMFPSAHDITPDNLDACLRVLRGLLAAGNEVLIVSKPHLACVDQLVADLRCYRDSVTFRFTIGALDDATLRLWEPGAPNSDERLASLVAARSAGFRTSVSAEPLLEYPAALIEEVDPYVTDTIWLGRANKLGQRLAANGAPPEVLEAGRRLMAVQTDDWCRDIYERWKGDEKIRFKDSIARLVGLPSCEVPA